MKSVLSNPEAVPTRTHWFVNSSKHLVDILVSLLGLIVLSPIFLLLGLLIKRESPGPVFYRGLRMGKGGRKFLILKFRTMRESSEDDISTPVTAQGDKRITPLGHWLRDTKLNELPQLWNVLKGEMSLIGPRPEDPEIVLSWPVDARREILSVRPGITSPASVLYRHEERMLSGEQVMNIYMNSILPSKLRLDQLYVRHHSFWLDLDVLLWTFLILIPRLGSFQPPEDDIFWGPISHLAKRYMSWFTIDALTSLFVFSIIGVIWRARGPLNVGWIRSLEAALGFALLFTVIAAVMGVQRIAWPKAATGDALYLLLPTFIATIITLVVNYILGLFPWDMVVLASVLSFVGFVIARYRSRLIAGLTSRTVLSNKALKATGERILIVGGGNAGQFAAWMIENSNDVQPFTPVGFVDDDLYKQGARIHGLDILGKREDIPSLVHQYDVGIIVFAIHSISHDEQQNLLQICRQTSARIVMLPDFLKDLRDTNATDGSKGIIDEEGDVRSQTKITTEPMDAWLQDLEVKVHSGQVEAVLKQIKELRETLRK